MGARGKHHSINSTIHSLDFRFQCRSVQLGNKLSKQKRRIAIPSLHGEGVRVCLTHRCGSRSFSRKIRKTILVVGGIGSQLGTR